MATKAERLAEFVRRLTEDAPAEDGAAAYALLTETMTRVEDELSGLPNDPKAWVDGRLYAPLPDAARQVRIQVIGTNRAIFEKAGHDGRHVFEDDHGRA